MPVATGRWFAMISSIPPAALRLDVALATVAVAVGIALRLAPHPSSLGLDGLCTVYAEDPAVPFGQAFWGAHGAGLPAVAALPADVGLASVRRHRRGGHASVRLPGRRCGAGGMRRWRRAATGYTLVVRRLVLGPACRWVAPPKGARQHATDVAQAGPTR